VTIVLDTNVLVAALVAKGLCHEVVQHGVRLHAIASSTPLIHELERTLREKFTLTPEATRFLQDFRAHVHMVEPDPLPATVCRDPDDDTVLATAIAADADVIVTGDADLLVLESYRGIRIRSPRQFLTALTPPPR